MPTSNEARLAYRRIPVKMHVPGHGTAGTYSTVEIGADTLLIEGAPNLRSGQVVELIFAPQSRHPVAVACVVVTHADSKLLVSLGDLQRELQERLDQVIWPAWDGASLIDGLILLAGRYGDATLGDWLRLTNLLTDIQPRLVHRRYADAMR